MKPGEDRDFWKSLRELVRAHRLVIDRPKGSAHPRYPDFIYPVDYGYLEGTTAADGNGIDVWKGSCGTEITGILCTVDNLKKDVETKIAIGCSETEVELIRRVSDSQFMKSIFLKKPDRPRTRSRRSLLRPRFFRAPFRTP